MCVSDDERDSSVVAPSQHRPRLLPAPLPLDHPSSRPSPSFIAAPSRDSAATSPPPDNERQTARRSPWSSHHRLASPGPDADYTTTSAVNTDLVYYLLHYRSTTVHTDNAVNVSVVLADAGVNVTAVVLADAGVNVTAVVLADAGVNGSLVQSALSAADDTCELMMTVDRQLAVKVHTQLSPSPSLPHSSK